MESKSAMYPRILVDRRLISTINDTNMPALCDIVAPLLARDWSGKVFVNPFRIWDAFNKIRIIYEESPEFVDAPKQIQIGGYPMCLFSADDETIERLENDKNRDLATVVSRLHAKLEEYKDDDSIFEKYLWLLHFAEWAIYGRGGQNFENLTE